VSERKGGPSGSKSGGGKGGKPDAVKGASAKPSASAKGAGGKPAPAKAESKASQKVAEQKPAEPRAAASAPAVAAAAQTAPGAAPAPRRAFKRTLVGRVKSDKMDKTVVVEVVRSKMDPVYKKYVRVRKSYQAHDEENAYKVGDRVEIIEHRPISKVKRWKVINLVERAVQE
jgi:small subunit ribosomal protein S17